jgi:hypothetical protein
MTNPTRVNDDANTQVCADAETAQPATETHSDVTYQVTPAQDGLVSYKPAMTGCAYCKRSDVPLRQADYVDKPACDPCAQIVERAMAMRLSQEAMAKANNPAAKPDIPEAWEDEALKVGEQAAMRARFEYEATMRAYEKQREDNEPAYWLKSDPCPPWCTNTNLHKSSDDPADREHDSDVLSVSLESMPPSVAYAEFRPPEVTAMLVQKFREVEPRVYINDSSDGTNLYATLDEAEKLAYDLLFLVAQARGKSSST